MDYTGFVATLHWAYFENGGIAAICWVSSVFLAVMALAMFSTQFRRRDYSTKAPAWIFYRKDREPVKKFGGERGYWTPNWKSGDWTLALNDE